MKKFMLPTGKQPKYSTLEPKMKVASSFAPHSLTFDTPPASPRQTFAASHISDAKSEESTEVISIVPKEIPPDLTEIDRGQEYLGLPVYGTPKIFIDLLVNLVKRIEQLVVDILDGFTDKNREDITNITDTFREINSSSIFDQLEDCSILCESERILQYLESAEHIAYAKAPTTDELIGFLGAAAERLYIFLDEDLPPLALQPIISYAPLNSSGDIYHIVAYLILAQSLKKKLPEVYLFYDAKSTQTQSLRSYHFARTLGFNGFFHEPIQLPRSTGCYRENARQADLEKHLSENYSDNIYVDQMATTTIIASLFLQYGWGKIVSWMQTGFTQRDEKFFPLSEQKKVDAIVENKITEVKTRLRTLDQPILVMHLRYSKNANSKQNIPDNFTNGIINYFKYKGYFTWCILADDRKSNLPTYAADYKTYPFSSPITDNQGVDYSKQTHLTLLLKLRELPNIKGIIGNTSGTLDLASFVGHRTYNIHQFGITIAYQDYRIAMQYTFSSVENLDTENVKIETKESHTPIAIMSDSDTTTIVERNLPNLSRWVHIPAQTVQ